MVHARNGRTGAEYENETRIIYSTRAVRRPRYIHRNCPGPDRYIYICNISGTTRVVRAPGIFRRRGYVPTLTACRLPTAAAVVRLRSLRPDLIESVFKPVVLRSFNKRGRARRTGWTSSFLCIVCIYIYTRGGFLTTIIINVLNGPTSNPCGTYLRAERRPRSRRGKI